MSGVKGFVSFFRVAWRGDIIDGSGRRTKRARESRVEVLVRRDLRDRRRAGRGVERYSGMWWVSGWIRREC
jgi:hypothetical protein